MANRMTIIPLFVVATILECSTAFSPPSILAKTATSLVAPVPSFPFDSSSSSQVVVDTVASSSSNSQVGWDVLQQSAPYLWLAEDGGGGGALDILKNIALAITAILFLFAGLTQVTASIIIPAAAKELEKECKELNPELWEEYQRKLEPGQTMAQRPELMQELGVKLQPLLDAKMERVFAEAKEQGVDMSEEERGWNAIGDLKRRQVPVPPPPAPSPSSENVIELSNTDWDEEEPSVVDVEVIVKEDQDETK